MPDTKHYVIYVFRKTSPHHCGFVRMIDDENFILDPNLYTNCVTLFPEGSDKIDAVITMLHKQNYNWCVFEY